MRSEEPKNNQSVEKENNHLKWKKLFAKKWFFPAVYVAATALILTTAWWYQGYQLRQTSEDMNINNMETAVEPQASDNQMTLPVAGDSQAEKTMDFYNEAASSKDKQASLVKYSNTYWPHTGVDFARKDGKTFDVVASLSGKVLRVEENPVVGHQVEIEHKDGLVTVYQSLNNVQVKKGQVVQKGDVIAQAGRNTFEKDSAVHLHFEVRQDGRSLNPSQYIQS